MSKIPPNADDEIAACLDAYSHKLAPPPELWAVRNIWALRWAVDQRDEARTQLAEARARIEVLKRALNWYASGSKPQEFSIVDDKGAWISDVHSFGDIARKALAACEEKEPTT